MLSEEEEKKSSGTAIIQLMLSLLVWQEKITLSGFYCAAERYRCPTVRITHLDNYPSKLS